MKQVKAAMEAADASLKSAHQRAARPLTADLLRGTGEHASNSDEDAAANDAARRYAYVCRQPLHVVRVLYTAPQYVHTLCDVQSCVYKFMRVQ
jgi:hypothetical protein